MVRVVGKECLYLIIRLSHLDDADAVDADYQDLMAQFSRLFPGVLYCADDPADTGEGILRSRPPLPIMAYEREQTDRFTIPVLESERNLAILDEFASELFGESASKYPWVCWSLIMQSVSLISLMLVDVASTVSSIESAT
ncbi:hypothetical protein AB5N19_13315 [Seiridium cardinale]